MKYIVLIFVLSSLTFAQSRKTVQDYWKFLNLEPDFKIALLDSKNNFIQFFDKPETVGGELVVWRSSGRDLVGFTTRTCAPICSTRWLQFSTPKGDTMFDVTSKMLPGVILPKDSTGYTYTTTKLLPAPILRQDSVRFNATLEQQFLRAYNKKSSSPVSSINDLFYYLVLPQKGTTLRVCWSTIGMCEIELGRFVLNGSSFVFQAVK